ncbi:alpha-glucosidase/oligosaccharide 4-alpha-D-glucosyltransferase [Gillisia sp. Hel_I_86]|uniref:glycoside hydrolase family 31 protein n=1 Tax=Gillisia sp. Hel_I_86 TaxID=1249981 RepID=UPI001199EEFC|nr:TIM-barrel domain-containing protein [Gillisia sp. Hel_I_86]TVZ25307.1 alpha-glucosidase/oligosaccharide 4-alpha-D-glucosyltransferase [Gillisia sp. Hel_I_86]
MKFLPNNKKALFLLFLGMNSFFISAQNANRTYKSFEQKADIINVSTNDGMYRFQAYSPEIMETSFIPAGEKFVPESYSVVLKPTKVETTTSEDASSVKIKTPGINVVITKKPFQVKYFFEGEEVISEKTGYSKSEMHQKLDFNISEYEMLFGGGARALGMNRRGNRLELYNRAHYGYGTKSSLLNYTLPIILSSEKYMLHFDNAPIGFLDLDSDHSNTLSYETISGRKTYQLIVGKSWEKILENYTLLTGRQPLPPRWVFGNFSSRFGYHSQEEVENTIEKFKKDSIPVDAVILDLYWFGHDIKGTMGNLEFVKDSFPQPKQMISELAEKGVKTVLVTEPFILTTSKKWEDAVKQNVLAKDSVGNPFKYDFYFGNTGLVDIFDPKAKSWFWNIYKDLKSYGVAGWWGDLGEPEVHPAKLQHSIGSADEVHNIYGHYWAKMIKEGYDAEFPEERPFILMRAGAAGSQRFGLIPWSGDVNRGWDGLKPQPEISLQMGLQGLAYMHSDLGGFAGNLEDDELYVRWLQYGVFQPIFRPHAQEEVASEPVFKKEKTKAVAKKAIELRYKLLPYNYTLVFENNQSGKPLMRPLFFEEPENYKMYTVSNTYLWGDSFLVSPILNPGVTTKEVIFPATNNWFDFYTGEKYSKGITASVKVVEDHIPVFVRGGAFIPMARPMQTTANYNPSVLDVHFYYDVQAKNSNGTIYNDNGSTPNAFEKGMYEIVKMEAEVNTGAINITIKKEEGENAASEIKLINLHIENLEKEVQFVYVNGIKFTGKNYMHLGNLNIPVRFDQTDTSIKIEFN